MEGLPLFNQDPSEVSHEAAEHKADFVGDELQNELVIERAGQFILGGNPLADDDTNQVVVDGDDDDTGI